LEGKDVKDLLLNVGSGGGAAAPAAGGAAAGGDAGGAEAAKEEEKEEGTNDSNINQSTLTHDREGRVGRRYGFRSFRLNICIYVMTGVLGVLYTTYGGLSEPLIDLANPFLLLLNQESTEMSLSNCELGELTRKLTAFYTRHDLDHLQLLLRQTTS
jgi:hypothetical protein